MFGALMALIALVAVAIDWVGRPLRNRRFIPRIYRYSDELPAQMPTFDLPHPVAVPGAYVDAQAPFAPPPDLGSVPAALAPSAPPLHEPPNASPLAHTVPAASAPPAPRLAASSASTFADSLESESTSIDGRDTIASTVPVESADEWHTGMALDSRVRDQSPTPAAKAERFWKSFAQRHGASSHFDAQTLALMADGKAPRRRNPRNGSIESVELVGLRAASDLGDVQMLWPDTSADPWSGA